MRLGCVGEERGEGFASAETGPVSEDAVTKSEVAEGLCVWSGASGAKDFAESCDSAVSLVAGGD